MGESESQGEQRYPLAFDLNGNPIKVPEGAVAWRVRRGGGRRGRPRNVFDAETGRQLEVPLGASLDDLIESGCPADRYLLYPVDAEGHILTGVVAVTEIQEGSLDEEGRPAVEHGDRDDIVSQLLSTVRAQSDTLCRALEAAASGYGQVRPAPPTPVIVEQPPPEPSGIKPDQIAQIVGVAKSVFDSFKAGGGAPPTEGGGS